MDESMPAPAFPIPDSPAPEPEPTPAPARRRGPGWLVTASLTVVALLAGAGAAFAGLLLTGWRHQPVQHYSVYVYFKKDVTDAQREAVHAVLTAIPGNRGVRLETSQQAYEKFKETFKDQPELLDRVTPSALPQSYQLETVSRDDFDCGLVRPLRTMPGMDQYTVILTPRAGRPGAKIAC
ncbi:hypothetical protein HH310_02035 [Actinoplanes sp. TBRC 11911]|uniref:permease-like cell division protein FtsX n=1 Tax=Actinoplanes sp. TBRC 11911 TaxID=2729386 RepID=UPI00145DAD4E|nr:permease-like cell division protein FtsX [Actinoplanes sp. TBRC 11911]NMO49975.1 hypothetical protein [Actinoplanes sp. TBRC 11911]